VSTKLAANECLRRVRYNYPDAELIEKAKALSAQLNHYAATENELARVKKDYGARIDVVQAQIDQLKECVQTGYEMREYVCFWEFDVPAPGRKTLRKREGGEIVTEEEMTQRDRQMVMDIIDAQAAGTAEIIPFERLALPAPKAYPTDLAEVTFEDQDACDNSDDELTGEWCECFSQWFTGIFIDPVDATLCADGMARHQVETVIDEANDETLMMFARWMRITPCVQAAPGSQWVLAKADAEIALRAAKLSLKRQKDAEEKKKSRAGRKANQSGTVSVDSDEGSRDDAGSDSKNNL
jgi:hypothetical protein